MGKYIKYFILGLILTGFPGSFIALNAKQKSTVLAEQVIMIPTPTITPTPTPSETPAPTPEPQVIPQKTPIPIYVPTPTPFPSSKINSLIDGFAGQYAVDPNVLRHIAICESGFNPLAVNGNYIGLYQFGPVTWQNIRVQIGEDTNPDLRFSAEESIQTAAYALSQGKNDIWPNCHP